MLNCTRDTQASRHRFRLALRLQDHDKFFAAKTVHRLIIARAALQFLRKGAQNFITNNMSVAIIDAFKVIDIQNHHVQIAVAAIHNLAFE